MSADLLKETLLHMFFLYFTTFVLVFWWDYIRGGLSGGLYSEFYGILG